MKKFLFTLLMLICIGYCQAQKQKAKPKTTTKPSGQTPPTAPPKPTARKIKLPIPGSLGVEKEQGIGGGNLTIRIKDTLIKH